MEPSTEDRFRHGLLATLGSFIHRRRWLVLTVSGLFLAASALMLAKGGHLTGGSIRGIECEQAESLVEEVLGHPPDNAWVAVFRAKQDDLTEDRLVAEVEKALAPLREHPSVLSVTGPGDGAEGFEGRLVNPSARSALAIVTLAGAHRDALLAYPETRALLQSDTLDIFATGRLPFLRDLGETLSSDLLRAKLISLPLALLVLLLVFRTVVAAVLPVGVGALAVLGGIAIVFGLSRHMDIAEYTVSVCSLIGLGVAIDYSLFIVARYREELDAGHDTAEALPRALATAGRVVVFSGVAVATGLSGLLFFKGSYLMSMGLGGAIVIGLSVVFALTFLPALLAVLGPKIHMGRLSRLPFLRSRRPPAGGSFWRRVALWVMRHPLPVLVPTLAILLCMGIPFLHLRMTASDVRVLPGEVEARRGYDLLRTDFPDRAEARLLVAVRFPSEPALPERVGALVDLSRSLAALPDVRKVESIVNTGLPLPREMYQTLLAAPAPGAIPGVPAELLAPLEAAKRRTVGERVVLLSVLTGLEPDDERARALVRAIREHREVGDGELLVGGATANDIDTTGFIMERVPYALAFVVGTTLVVLFLLLGSVLLPIKAVIMNLVSIAGSFGALVWVFQDANLFIQEGRPIEPSLPVLLFCILFGLSMDYEVLMLSRIKESYERTGDNMDAVVDGLEKSAGLITSAAVIMVAVFCAFTLARVVLIQATGFGMALAVALDATLVRVLLVPSTMRLLGHLNWWAPRPLLALRQRLGGGRLH